MFHLEFGFRSTKITIYNYLFVYITYIYIYIYILPTTTSNQYHWKNSTLSSSMASELLTRKPAEILSLELLIHVPLPIQWRKTV